MKHFVPLAIAAILLCCKSEVKAQFTLEHTYDEAFVFQIRYQQNGDLYAASNFQTSGSMLYDVTHTLVADISAQPPVGQTYIYTSFFDEDLGNPDATFEMAYIAQDDTAGILIGHVQQVNGAILGSLEGISEMLYLPLDTATYVVAQYNDLLTNLPDSFAIYNLANFNHEITFSADKMLGARYFDQSGVKVCLYDSTSDNILIYNTDFTLWKTFPVNLNLNEEFAGLELTTEQIADADTLLELGFMVNDGNGTIFRFQKENGAISIEAPSYLSEIYDLGNGPKLLSQNPAASASEIYDLTTGTLEFSFSGGLNLRLSKFLSLGDKWVGFNNSTREYVIYNSDYSIFDQGYLSANQGDLILNVWVTDNVFNTDADIEILFSFFGGNGNDGVRVQRADGSIWDEYYGGANGAQLAYVQDLQAHRLVIFGMNGTLPASHVLSWDATSSIAESATENQVLVYPNPAQQIINIEQLENDQMQSISVYDQAGREVLSMTADVPTNQLQLNVEALANGLYVLLVQGTEGVRSTKFLIQR